MAVEFIREHSPGWEISSERKMEEIKLEEEKRERLEKAAVKKRTTHENILRKKIEEKLRALPKETANEFESGEERQRRIDLKEAKENTWKKWRKATKLKAPKATNKEQLEIKLSRIEQLLEKVKKEKEDLKEKEEKENIRRRKYIEEKRSNENEKIEREKEKLEKLRKKKKLEQHWEMMRWLVAFLDEKREDWECLEELRKAEKAHGEEKTRWQDLDISEKFEELKETNTSAEEK